MSGYVQTFNVKGENNKLIDVVSHRQWKAIGKK